MAWGWSDGSVVKGICFLSRRLKLHSQCPHGSSHPPVTQIPERLMPCSGIWGLQACKQHTDIGANKIPIQLKNKINFKQLVGVSQTWKVCLGGKEPKRRRGRKTSVSLLIFASLTFQETDYIMSYFDNGEDFGGDSDDNMDEAIYWKPGPMYLSWFERKGLKLFRVFPVFAIIVFETWSHVAQAGLELSM